MCDYCGCRQSEPFAELSREHSALASLGSELRGALRDGSEERARDLLCRIVEILGFHVRKEERGLFTRVVDENDIYEGIVEDLIGEHADLAHTIEHIAEADAGWAEAAVGLLEALDEHIFKEEWDLFPAALGILGFEDLEAIARVHAEEGTAMEDAAT